MSSTYKSFGKFYHINAHSMQNKAQQCQIKKKVLGDQILLLVIEMEHPVKKIY